jgi:uncharacterized phage protein (TIGR01671 family)
MMREIKFRAIRKRDKRLIWPIAIYQSGGDPVVEWLGPTGTTELSSTPGNDVWLMQYTGLKDANGREIYEGDIVAYRTPMTESGKWVTERREVAFRNGSFVLLLSDSSWRGFTAESLIILGNIYENSELLR